MSTVHVSPSATALEPAGRPSRPARGFRRAAVVGALVVAVGFGGLPMLLGGWSSDAHDGTHRIHEIAAGAHLTLVAALLLLAGLSPRRRAAAVQAFAATILATAVGSVAAGDPGAAAAGAVVFGLPLAVLVGLHPDRGELWRGSRGFSPVLGPLVLLAAVPLARFAGEMARFQRILPGDEAHAAEFHWGGMAVFAAVVVAVGLVASLRTAGNVAVAWCAGGALAVLGVASVVWPALPSTLGTGWGVAAVAGGVAFGALATAEARRLDRDATR
jgi:hypothetical protein